MSNPITLSPADLETLVKIIDLGSNRGIFNGPDLSPVGAVRDRLVQTITEAKKSAGAEFKAETTGNAH